MQNQYGKYAKIEATDIDDRGRGSAESRYCADFAITATVGDFQKTVRKAILFQVKNQPVDSLFPSETKNLKEQIKKMKKVVSSPKISVIRRSRKGAMLEVYSNRALSGFNQRVITTLDGTTDETIVDALQESNLKKLNVYIKG